MADIKSPYDLSNAKSIVDKYYIEKKKNNQKLSNDKKIYFDTSKFKKDYTNYNNFVNTPAVPAISSSNGEKVVDKLDRSMQIIKRVLEDLKNKTIDAHKDAVNILNDVLEEEEDKLSVEELEFILEELSANISTAIESIIRSRKALAPIVKKEAEETKSEEEEEEKENKKVTKTTSGLDELLKRVQEIEEERKEAERNSKNKPTDWKIKDLVWDTYDKNIIYDNSSIISDKTENLWGEDFLKNMKDLVKEK